ncbi:hypothetical protein QOZ98_001392 [Planomicrobium stackebrandtii]|uniref:DUF6036 domain-containing protein n=1 Tax=Planomicrobium stackebrandtii TaxID=253160 RepID=A0ABU0GT79_9BACL|nr:DUF6036 family nucleotidyltransferase [Planomicrobium stackebrandtii]MDQ0428566.1 hypothetical protein [Planomicrobium stackebrandtii]
MKEMSLEDVIRELVVLDLICQEENTNLEIALFGGAAILIHLGDTDFRATRDIDFRVENYTSEEKLNKIMEAKPGVFQRLGMFPEFPDQALYREHGDLFLLEGIPFENLKIFLPDIEMLALSKLVSKRGKDLEDLKTKPILDECDLELLHSYLEEAKTYFFNTSEFNLHEWDDILAERGLNKN